MLEFPNGIVAHVLLCPCVSSAGKWNPGCHCSSVTACSVLSWQPTRALSAFLPALPSLKTNRWVLKMGERRKGSHPFPSLSSISLGWQPVLQRSLAKASWLAVLRTWTLKRLLFSTSCLPPNKFLAQLETQMLSSPHPGNFLSAELKDEAFIWSVICLVWL